MDKHYFDVIIIGSGMVGLYSALKIKNVPRYVVRYNGV